MGNWLDAKTRVLVLGICLLGIVCPGPVAATEDVQQEDDIEVFTRQGCPHCAAARLFLDDLQRERPRLKLTIRDIGKDQAALARLRSLSEQHRVGALGVPAFYLRGELIIGYSNAETTGKRLKTLLDRPSSQAGDVLPEGACGPEAESSCGQETVPLRSGTESIETRWFGRLSLPGLGLPAFTVVLGLLDGFNPCAMWVLLFLLSLLVNLQDRVKMLLIAGTFVAVSGLVYFAFMAAWLNVFLLIGLSRVMQVVLGGIAGLVGVINVKDFFAVGKGLSLAIPQAAKPGLYARIRKVVQAENLYGALAGSIVLAVLVNTVELLCTAGFPAVYTQILALRQLPWWEYYGYLGLYNLAYILDDSLMVTIAVMTLGRRRLQEKQGRWLKLISGVVMLGLGGILIAKPEWLA